MSLFRVSTAWLRVGHDFWPRVGPMPRVSPLNSRVAFRSQVSGIVFNIADISEVFHWSCLDRVFFPDQRLTLSRLSASFLLAYFLAETARAF